MSISRTELMNNIIKVRHTSPEIERKMADMLMQVYGNDDYSIAFARLYMGDADLSLGKINEAIEELSSSMVISEKHGYDKLLLTTYNLLGICYGNIDDEQSSLDYYFAGIKIAAKLKDNLMLGALYSNIGVLYMNIASYDRAAETISMGYEAAQAAKNNDSNIKYTKEMYVRNIANINVHSGNISEAKEQVEFLMASEENSRVSTRIIAASYYAESGETEKSSELIKAVMTELDDIIDEITRISYYFDLISILTKLKDYETAYQLIGRVSKYVEKIDIPGKWKSLCEVQIELAKNTGDEELLDKAYKIYYENDVKLASDIKKAGLNRVKKRIDLHNEIENHRSKVAEKNILLNKAEYDELTEIYNRKYVKSCIEEAYKIAMAEGSSMAVMILDIDYFKEYNDSYGHLEGDKCLKMVAHAITDAIGEDGAAGRYGGDEFIITVSGKTKEELAEYINKIRKNIQNLNLKSENSAVSDQVTVTIGAVNYVPDRNTEILALIHAADSALYEIKKTTRNGFCILETL